MMMKVMQIESILYTEGREGGLSSGTRYEQRVMLIAR